MARDIPKDKRMRFFPQEAIEEADGNAFGGSTNGAGPRTGSDIDSFPH